MKLTILAIFLTLALGVQAAQAACSAKSPKHKWNFHSDDQRLSGAYLAKTLTGKKVRYDDGSESYGKKGDYTYRAGSSAHRAPAFRFYPDGVRCIAYDRPRYDVYVVNNGKLVLVNWQGGRYEGKVTR